MRGRLVRLTVEAGIATVRLDSPHNRNALSRRLRRELLDHLERASADPAVRVVVLTHEGPVFCAGADLKEGGAAHDDRKDAPMASILRTMARSPKPIVVRLAGAARAGGLGLVAAADIAIAADDVTFALTEVRLGLVPALIGAVVVPRTDPSAIRRLMLTGEAFSASEAERIGLITSAVPGASLDDTVERISDALARGAPDALAATKRMLRSIQEPDLDADLDRLAELSARSFAADEAAEGVAAFLERRDPSWVPAATRVIPEASEETR